MHLNEDELFELANAQCKGMLLSDMQIRQKGHLAECRECYEKFCIYMTLMDLTGYAQEDGLLDKSGYTANPAEAQPAMPTPLRGQLQEICLQIRMKGETLVSIQTVGRNLASYWNFIHIPAPVVRSGAEEKDADIYVSEKSGNSRICQEGKNLVIRLDAEVFPVENLGVRYEKDGEKIVRKFEHKKASEYYEAVVEAAGDADAWMVEIIWLVTPE